MGFDLVAFDKLKSDINESIKALFKHHKLSYDDYNNEVAKLPKDRQIQVQFLNTVIHCLEEPGCSFHKSPVVLNAAVYFIRQKISDSYQSSLPGTSLFLSPKSSTFYVSLSQALGLEEKQNLSIKVNSQLYGMLRKFLFAATYLNPEDPEAGYKDNHPFSSANIPGYEVEKDLISLLKIRSELGVEMIQNAQKANEEQTQQKSQVSYS